MNQIKIGKFIAECGKRNNITKKFREGIWKNIIKKYKIGGKKCH